jgi:tetratricopeptide (TPR) repeat protein
MTRRTILLSIALAGGVLAQAPPPQTDLGTLRQEALAAEARQDTGRALELYLELERANPRDAFVLQKIARQYSDREVEMPTPAGKKSTVERALTYARRAVELEPRNAVNVLSLAICYGKLGLYSDVRTKVEYSRHVKEEAERALSLDPGYAWAHHVLGRWHYEVGTLGSAARLWVRLFYGGLPAASTSEAVRLLEKAIALEPDELAHRLELGFALLADGQARAAEAAFRAGLAMPSRAKHDDAAKIRARAALARLSG